MPFITKWVSPEVFLVHKNVIVFHKYPDDEYENCPYEYYYTTDERADNEYDEYGFDVLSLNTPSKTKLEDLQCRQQKKSSTKSQVESGLVCSSYDDGKERSLLIKAIIAEAIDLGLINICVDNDYNCIA